jgi:hypothetical protein
MSINNNSRFNLAVQSNENENQSYKINENTNTNNTKDLSDDSEKCTYYSGDDDGYD